MIVPSSSFPRYRLILRGFVPDIDQKMVNLQNAVESRLEGAERTDFTGKMVPSSSFFDYGLILCGFVLMSFKTC